MGRNSDGGIRRRMRMRRILLVGGVRMEIVVMGKVKMRRVVERVRRMRMFWRRELRLG